MCIKCDNTKCDNVKILLYTDLDRDIADVDDSDMESSLRFAQNVWEAISERVLGVQVEDEAFDLGTIWHNGKDSCTLSYWIVLHLKYCILYHDLKCQACLVQDCTPLMWEPQ